jgi:hypothetical protein
MTSCSIEKLPLMLDALPIRVKLRGASHFFDPDSQDIVAAGRFPTILHG